MLHKNILILAFLFESRSGSLLTSQ